MGLEVDEMEMIERVARAIYKVDGEKGWHLHSQFYLNSARAAIEAMREPDPHMIAHMYDGPMVVSPSSQDDDLAIYRAMIDAALK